MGAGAGQVPLRNMLKSFMFHGFQGRASSFWLVLLMLFDFEHSENGLPFLFLFFEKAIMLL